MKQFRAHQNDINWVDTRGNIFNKFTYFWPIFPSESSHLNVLPPNIQNWLWLKTHLNQIHFCLLHSHPMGRCHSGGFFWATGRLCSAVRLGTAGCHMNSSEILKVTIGYFKVSQIFYKIIREIGSVFNSGKKRETEIVLVLLPSWQPRAQAAP